MDMAADLRNRRDRDALHACSAQCARRALALALAGAAIAAAGCAAPVEPARSDHDDFTVTVSLLTAEERRERAGQIRDAALASGMTQGYLLAGIADAETSMSHCWSELTWACQGPASPDCGGGPVVAGAGDGPCEDQQGGLGMFQFDAGTYQDTLAREGERILYIDGNVQAAVDFVTGMLIRSVYIDGIDDAAQAIAWSNGVRRDNERWDPWLRTVTHYYNGCTPSASCWEQRYAHYLENTSSVFDEMGAAFWETTPEYAAAYVHQTFPLAADPFELAPGAEFAGYIELRNAGSAAWSPGATFLGTTEPRDGPSALAAADWIAPHRAATVDREVAPGESGRFAFTVRAPAQPGDYPQFFNLVQEGVAWFGDRGGPPDNQLQVRVTVVAGAQPPSDGEPEPGAGDDEPPSPGDEVEPGEAEDEGEGDEAPCDSLAGRYLCGDAGAAAGDADAGADPDAAGAEADDGGCSTTHGTPSSLGAVLLALALLTCRTRPRTRRREPAHRVAFAGATSSATSAARLCVVTAVASTSCSTGAHDTRSQSAARCDAPAHVAVSAQALSTIDCAQAQDTGYMNGTPFPITVVTVDGEQVEKDTANAYFVMAQAADRDGVALQINSGFRTMAEQERLYACYVECNCNNCNLAAEPGYSNHQSGHALDLNASAPGVLDWLNAHAGAFGFEATVASENWHWEWWGGGPGGGPCTVAYAGRSLGISGQSYPIVSQGPAVVAVGETISGWVKLENTGTAAWQPGVVWMAPIPRDQPSPFASASWRDPTRISSVTAEVAPGQVGEFALDITGTAVGSSILGLGWVAEQMTWFADPPNGGGPEDGYFAVAVEVVAAPDGPAAGEADAAAPSDDAAGEERDDGDEREPAESDAAVEGGEHDAAAMRGHDGGITGDGGAEAGAASDAGGCAVNSSARRSADAPWLCGAAFAVGLMLLRRRRAARSEARTPVRAAIADAVSSRDHEREAVRRAARLRVHEPA